MKSILLKEIKSFFSSAIGIMVLSVFLIINGIFLFVLTNDFNIINSAFADLSPFFKLSPYILLFLIPAVTMRTFADEIKQGTIELLLTKPTTVWQIVLGKFFGAILLIVLALLPTLVYVGVVWQYGLEIGNLDMGSTIGSYFGLLFLIASYTAIGIFSSTLSENQIVSFIIAVCISYILFLGLEQIEGLLKFSSNIFESLGMYYHFKSMSRGVLDTRNIIYFLSITVLFLSISVYKIKSLKW